jgi:hypothetical protein
VSELPTFAEIDRRARAIAERELGGAIRNAVRVLNASNLSEAERERFGLEADWKPAPRRRRGR